MVLSLKCTDAQGYVWQVVNLKPHPSVTEVFGTAVVSAELPLISSCQKASLANSLKSSELDSHI